VRVPTTTITTTISTGQGDPDPLRLSAYPTPPAGGAAGTLMDVADATPALSFEELAT
jgi:hypothetical protein